MFFKKCTCFLFVLNCCLTITAQTDSSKLEIGAYVSSYYAYYADGVTNGGFVQFPTMAARNSEFGLNLAQVSMAYKSRQLRSNVTIHYGDVAETTWPTKFNMIQEANAGINLYKNLWLDVGFFRSHIGLESTQPRENITSSMSLPNVFEPYVFSGAKLTYVIHPKISLQLHAFNGFNTFVETNSNKAIGMSCIVSPSENLSITYNFLTCDETPDVVKTRYQRYYNNLYFTYKNNKLTVGGEVNFGLQEKSQKQDSTKSAQLVSGLVVAKHQTFEKAAFYSRAEYFSDKDEMLSIGSNMGNYTWGITSGIEFKPLKNVALSLEGRLLESDNSIYYYNKRYTYQRWETIACIDVWF